MQKRSQQPKQASQENTEQKKQIAQQNQAPLANSEQAKDLSLKKQQDKINEQVKIQNNVIEIEMEERVESMQIERNNGRGDEGDEGNQQNWESDSSGMEDQNEQMQQQGIIMDQNLQSGQQGQFDDLDDQYDSYQQQQEIQNKKHKFEITKMNINSLSPLIKIVLENISNNKSFIDLIKMPPSKKIKKQVCARVITGNITVVECFDCRMDPTCIICEDCFKNGNHEGHRYVLKKFAGGCCDCGDPEAWSEKGFCKNHSGLFQDFQVQPKVLEQFTDIMDGLFYLYFYLLLTNDKNSKILTQKLLAFLNKLNNENTYYNKLTAQSLTKKLPSKYSLNEKLDNKTILQNILTSRISGNYFKRWFDLFINMFPYYPFKLDIIKHYIQNYGDIVDGAQGSASKALSISCQIMTSYKVVDQYSKEFNIGLGQRSQTPIKTKQLFEYCKMFFHDIQSLTTLSEKASFNYWKMHINSKESIRNLFQYYRILLKKVKSYEGENSKSQVQIIAKFINFSQTEHQLIQIFSKILKIVSQEPKLVQKLIYVLWKELQKVNKEYNPESLCIFRPIQRCLTLAIFQYFECSLENIEVKKQKLIKDVLKINENTFEIDSSVTIKKIFKTLFFYSKTQSSSGLAQTSYIYLYFYKIMQRLLSMTDIVCLKIFLLLANNPYPLTFESIMELNKDKISNLTNQTQYLKQQQLYFASCLSMSKIVFTTYVPEIYLTYTIHPQPVSQACQYKKEIKEIILNFFKQKQNSNKYQVPQIDVKSQLLEGILPASCKIADKWIKTNCTLNKNKKVFVLDSKIMEEQLSINGNINGLNFDDFMISLSSKDAFSDISKSINFIKGYNLHLFNILWNNISLESLNTTLHDLYNQSNKLLADSYNYSIVLPTIITVYILTKSQSNPNKPKNISIITQILKQYLPRIPKNIVSSLAIHLDCQEQISGQKQKIQEQEINNEKEQKKQKSNEIKLKKLESMKKKQKQFLQKKFMVQEQQQISDQFPNKNTNKQNQQTFAKCCNICKNELNENSVYILNFTIRDHEKLLKLGKGLQCISINSCRHMFDFDCIKSMYKKNHYVDSISCSLCKFQGNVIFPASSNFSEKLAQQIHDRFIQLLFIIKENADFYEEIIKSFYHYVLLCGLDFSRITNKKGELYHILLTVLKRYIPSKQIDLLKEKLLNKKISKGFEKSLKTPSCVQRPNITSFFFNLLRNENIQDALDMQVEMRLDIQKQQSIVEPKKKVEYKQDEKQNYTQLFFIVVSEILEFLANKNQSQHKMEDEQEEKQSITFVRDCLKTITGSPNTRIFERSSLYDIYNKNNMSILKKMPQKYIELSINKKCRQCSEISQQAIMCLQCNWVGCQKQQKCLAKTHINSEHGQVGAIMIIQKTSAYYITSQKYIYAGELYEDEWQNNILQTQDWSNFELNINLLKEMQRNILLDDIPTRHSKKKA